MDQAPAPAGDLPLLSATQIDIFAPKTGCQRKWAFKYIERVEVPKSPGAELGTEVQDEQIDPYLLNGRKFDFSRKSGEIALAISSLLPPPMTPGMQLRRKFLIPSPSGRFAYRGEFDMFGATSSIVPGLDARRAVDAPGSDAAPLLLDIKTTKYLDFAKTPAQLLEDVQCELYGAAIMYLDNVDELDAYWVYGRTVKPHKTFGRYVRLRAAHVFEQFERIDEIGRELVAIKLAKPKNAHELPPNPRMCDAYGGCPYRHLCNLSPSVHAAAVNQEAKDMSATTDFLAGLRKQTGAAQAPPAAPAPAAPPPVVNGPGNAWLPPSPLEHAPAAVATPAQAAAVATPAQAAAAGLPPWASAPVDPRSAPATVNPPVFRPVAAAPAAPAAPAAINPPESALPPAPPVGAAAQAAAGEVAPKAKRGRPAKAATGPTTQTETEAAEGDGLTLANVPDLAAFMKENGIKRLGFFGGAVTEIEVGS